MEVTLALAFIAGTLSFASPCVLALVPVYLAFLGESAADPAAPAPGRAILLQALLFVAGFSVLFILLGVSVGLLGGPLFGESRPLVRQAAGVIVILLGLVMTGLFGPVFERLAIRTPTELLPSTRFARAFVLGVLVAIGWTPCIGAVLGAILTLGLSTREVGSAALLLAVYSAGLAVPFLVAALALPRVRPLMEWLRRHHRGIQVVSGAFIIAVGVLILTDAFSALANLFTFFI